MSPEKKFLELIDPDMPKEFAARLHEDIRHGREAHITAENISEMLIEPLRWYMEQAHGKKFDYSSAHEFYLLADELRYRFSNHGMIVPEQIDVLVEMWRLFQASQGWNSQALRIADAPLVKRGRQFKPGKRQGAKGRFSKMVEYASKLSGSTDWKSVVQSIERLDDDVQEVDWESEEIWLRGEDNARTFKTVKNILAKLRKAEIPTSAKSG